MFLSLKTGTTGGGDEAVLLVAMKEGETRLVVTENTGMMEVVVINVKAAVVGAVKLVG